MDRSLYIFGSITSELSKEIIANLIFFDSQSNDDISIYINSIGGSAVDGLAICDTMNLLKSDVKTICIGNASSIAAVILTCGTKGKRFISRNAFVMIHEVQISTSGKLSDIALELEHAEELNKCMKSMIQKNTKLDNIELLEKNQWYDSNKAIKYGIVDKIIN